MKRFSGHGFFFVRQVYTVANTNRAVAYIDLSILEEKLQNNKGEGFA